MFYYKDVYSWKNMWKKITNETGIMLYNIYIDL